MLPPGRSSLVGTIEEATGRKKNERGQGENKEKDFTSIVPTTGTDYLRVRKTERNVSEKLKGVDTLAYG